MLTKSDLTAIQEVVKTETTQIVKTELAPVKKDVRQIKKTMNEMLDVLDKQDMLLLKRVKKLEEHVGVNPQ